MRGRTWLLRGARVTALVLISITSSFPIWADEQGALVTLTRCIDAALSGGPDAALARATLAVSQAQYAQAVAQNALGLTAAGAASRSQPLPNNLPTALGQGGTAFGPSGGVSVFATDRASTSLSLANGTTSPSTRLDLSVAHSVTERDPLSQYTTVSLSSSQTVWDGYAGGRALAAVQQAGITLKGRQAADELTRRTVVSNVKKAYYTVLADQRQIEVLTKTLAQRDTELERTQTLFTRQDATRIDLQQAQVNREGARLDLAQARDTREVDREKLSALAGWPAETAYDVAGVEDLILPDVDAAGAVRRALAQRVDLRQMRLNRAAGDVTLALRRSQASPVVSATGGLSMVQDWSTGYVFPSMSAGVSVSAPVTDGGLTDQEVREARMQNQAYDIQAAQLVSSISTDVKSALYSLRNLTARASLAEASLALARDNYTLYLTQYDMGVSTTLDLLTASVGLTTAETSLEKARSDVQLGILALQDAMGE
jgi:outer membrane protein